MKRRIIDRPKRPLGISTLLSLAVIYIVLSLVVLPKPSYSAEEATGCGLIQFLDQAPLTPEEILEFSQAKSCGANEISFALPLSKNPVLLGMLEGLETDFTNAKSAIFLLEVGGDREVALSVLSAALVSASVLADEEAQHLRFLISLTLEDLRRQLGMPKVETTIPSIIAAFTSADAEKFEKIKALVPYCALLSVDLHMQLDSILISRFYQSCISRKDSKWRTITDLI